EVTMLPRMSRAITGLMTASYSVSEPTGQLSIVKSAGQGQSLLSYSGDTPKNWRELPFDISSEAFAVDRPVEDARGDKAVAAQRAEKGQRPPVGGCQEF